MNISHLKKKWKQFWCCHDICLDFFDTQIAGAGMIKYCKKCGKIFKLRPNSKFKDVNLDDLEYYGNS